MAIKFHTNFNNINILFNMNSQKSFLLTIFLFLINEIKQPLLIKLLYFLS